MDNILENSTIAIVNFQSLDNSTTVNALVFRKYTLKNLGVRNLDISNLLSDGSTKTY